MHVNYFHSTKLIDLADGGLYREKRKEAPISDASRDSIEFWLQKFETNLAWRFFGLKIVQSPKIMITIATIFIPKNVWHIEVSI